MQRIFRATLLLLTPLFASDLTAQGTQADYDRAAGLRRQWSGKLRSFRPQFRWLAGDVGIWWTDRRAPKGERVVVIDTKTGARKVFPDLAAAKVKTVEVALEPARRWGRSARTGGDTTVTFINRLDRAVRLFWVDERGRTRAYGQVAPGERREQQTRAGHLWVGDFAANDLCGIFTAGDQPGIATFDARSRRLASGGARGRRQGAGNRAGRRGRDRAGPGGVRLRIRDHNVVGVAADGTEFVLSENGTAADPYQQPRWWSPDGTKALGMQVIPATQRRVTVVESSPKDQVQPKVVDFGYTKPGDRLDQPRPRLFDVAGRRQIPVADQPFLDSFRISRVTWAADSSKVYLLFNRRGHQELALRVIDASTGAVRDVIREGSKTFVDYSQKTYLQWLKGGQEILWASERDGWNHLYRFGVDGKQLAQVTKGPWVVRKVEWVDEAAGQVWLTAMGIRPNQDPYHKHLVRVDLDGRNLVVLTEGDGTHEWTFSPDKKFFIDRWSRVDAAPVTELRRAADGKRIAVLGQDDDSALRAAGFRPPQRFRAMGRDGETPIYGILIRPSNFDPERRYPVIESIYAGPHDHHVPKSFGMSYRQRRLAELGFIVVQIDGMGTNWRSKSFHDVCWQNLKDAGFPDRIAWLRAAAKEHPELDLSRVGIFGGSAGGQNALGAVLHHGDFYRAAVADCGCHDNRMDKIWWNEAWMGKLGPHYADSSNVTHARRLTGKLMLTVGELDRNVDPASTMQVVNALIRADKDFDLIVVPGGGHGVGERPYLVRRRQDFFVRALLGVEPRG